MKIIAAVSIGLAFGSSALTTPAQQRSPLTVNLPNNVSLEFVRIPPGEFMMGCSMGDTQCADDEEPAHRVRITRAFDSASMKSPKRSGRQ